MKMLLIVLVAVMMACTGCQAAKGIFHDLSWGFHTLEQNIAEK